MSHTPEEEWRVVLSQIDFVALKKRFEQGRWGQRALRANAGERRLLLLGQPQQPSLYSSR